MSVAYIDRSKDEEIIDIMRSIFSNGNWEVETFNEAVLTKLLILRGTPIECYSQPTLRDIDNDYDTWKNLKDK